MLDELSVDEKKILYPMIAVVLIVLIVVLFFIWKPINKNIRNNINIVQGNLDYSDIQVEKYSNILKNLLLTANFDELYNKISNEWMTANNLITSQDVKEYLFRNFIITTSGVNIKRHEVYSSDDLYIFKFVIDSNGIEKAVLINEVKPYDYTISFEQEKINSLTNKEYNYTFEEMDYVVNTKYASENILQYEVNVTNNHEKDSYMWMMEELSSVALVLSDGSEINPIDMTSFGIFSVGLAPKGSFSFKITFNANLEKQSMIESIKFSNVYKNGAVHTINVVLNGGV